MQFNIRPSFALKRIYGKRGTHFIVAVLKSFIYHGVDIWNARVQPLPIVQSHFVKNSALYDLASFNMIGFRVLPFLLSIALAACDDGYLRGAVTISSDGKTYLAVVDDNGGGCGPNFVDGKIWSHSIGEVGLITPGHHKIQCGGWIEFDIPEGVVFHFDYWGP